MIFGIDFTAILQSKYFGPALRIILLLVIGLPFFKIIASTAGKVVTRKVSAQVGMITRKIIFYSGFVIILFMVLRELGFKLTALLGAAGVAGVALGFAAQTSLSNLISGLFLIGEKPFQVGDLIRLGERSGIVVSIDLLSVKLRTLDNLFVRIPNETLIKQEVVNVTRYPIRRMDINLGVAYKEDAGKVMAVLKEIAKKNPYCLNDPEPLLVFKDFGDSALELLFGVWFVKTDYLKLRNSIMKEIKERFDQEGIEIPFPHRTIYTGSATDPWPVALQTDKPKAKKRSKKDK